MSAPIDVSLQEKDFDGLTRDEIIYLFMKLDIQSMTHSTLDEISTNEKLRPFLAKYIVHKLMTKFKE